ncbi:MAG: hypothetical protein KH452_13795 [Clostridiales bacterium]|nr:hypothetical protein [Clostridiales bacterium]
MNKKRTFLIRALAVLVLLVIAGIMLVIGRGHTIYFDNKTMEYNGTTVEALYKVEVTVKGERVAKLYERDRGMAPCMGQSFEMTLEVIEEKGGEASAYDISMAVPYNMDGIVLNIPALLEGLPEEAYQSEFVPVITEEEEEEEIITDEFENMGDF